MKMEDFDKSEEELRKEMESNNRLIALCEKRAKLAHSNQFEDRAIDILGFSFFAYLGIIGICAILIKTGNIASLTSILPRKAFPLIMTESL